MYHVYILCDPTTSEVRYVGLTCVGLADRLKNHYAWARYHENAPLSQWLTSLNEQPLIVSIDQIQDRTEAEEMEKQWIAVYYALGTRLTNRLNLRYKIAA